MRFGVHVRNDHREGTPPLVRLKALCGPGDDGELVVLVMLPEEDRAADAPQPGSKVGPGLRPAAAPIAEGLREKVGAGFRRFSA